MQDISRQVGIAIRWLPLILICALAAGAIAYTWASGQPSVYEATARLIVNPGPDPSVQDLAVAEAAAVRYADQARSRPAALAVIDTLGLTEGAQSLRDRIETSVSEDTFEVIIRARDKDAAAARVLALAVGNEVRLRVKDTIITDEVRAADSAIAANRVSIRILQNRLEQLRKKANKDTFDRQELISLTGQISNLQRDIQGLQPSSRAYVRNRLEWFDRPTAPITPTEPRPLYWTLLAIVVGGMLAVGIAFVVEYLRHYGKVRDEDDLEAATGLLALGSVFEKRGDIKRGDPERVVMLTHPGSEAAESYRGLLAKIGFASGPARAILVASADPSDGKSTVAANLAAAYAEAGRNVILVDADYRSPRLHSFFGVRNDRGVTNVMVDNDVPLSWVTVPTAHPRLRLVPGGPPPPRLADALGSVQVEALLGKLADAADMVVFNSPAMAGSLDAAVLASYLQEAVLVVSIGSSGESALEAARALQRAETDVVGGVLYRQVRGSHKRTASMPIVVPPGGQAPKARPPSSPPRRIPAVVMATAPPAATTQASAGRAQGPYGPPTPPGTGPTGATPPPPASGPYATSFKPDDAPSDG